MAIKVWYLKDSRMSFAELAEQNPTAYHLSLGFAIAHIVSRSYYVSNETGRTLMDDRWLVQRNILSYSYPHKFAGTTHDRESRLGETSWIRQKVHVYKVIHPSTSRESRTWIFWSNSCLLPNQATADYLEAFRSSFVCSRCDGLFVLVMASQSTYFVVRSYEIRTFSER